MSEPSSRRWVVNAVLASVLVGAVVTLLEPMALWRGSTSTAESDAKLEALQRRIQELSAAVDRLGASAPAIAPVDRLSTSVPTVAPPQAPLRVRPTLEPVNRSAGRGGVMYADEDTAEDTDLIRKMRDCYKVVVGDGPTTNRALLEGVTIRPVRDELLRNITAESIAEMQQRSPCVRRLQSRRDDPDRVRVEVCTLVRNRKKIAVEGILWWILMGVDFVTIFDDGSQDGVYEALFPLIDAGLVHMESVPPPPFKCFPPRKCIHGGLQVSVYAECTKRAWAKDGKRYGEQQRRVARGLLKDTDSVSFNPTWMAYVDSDEFAILPQEGTCIYDIIETNIYRATGLLDNSTLINASTDRSTLPPLPTFDTRFGQLALPWRMVFREGTFLDVSRTQLEWNNYPRARMDHLFAVKCVARTDLVVNFNSMHWARLKNSKYETWFGTGEVAGPWHSPGYYDVYLRDNHTTYNVSYILHFPVTSLAQLLRRHSNGNVAGAKPDKGFSAHDVLYWWYRETGNAAKPPLAPWIIDTLRPQNELLTVGLNVADIAPRVSNITARELVAQAEANCRRRRPT